MADAWVDQRVVTKSKGKKKFRLDRISENFQLASGAINVYYTIMAFVELVKALVYYSTLDRQCIERIDKFSNCESCDAGRDCAHKESAKCA